jgi:hypothetical protein
MHSTRLWLVITVAALCGIPVRVRESFLRSELANVALIGDASNSS